MTPTNSNSSRERFVNDRVAEHDRPFISDSTEAGKQALLWTWARWTANANGGRVPPSKRRRRSQRKRGSAQRPRAAGFRAWQRQPVPHRPAHVWLCRRVRSAGADAGLLGRGSVTDLAGGHDCARSSDRPRRHVRSRARLDRRPAPPLHRHHLVSTALCRRPLELAMAHAHRRNGRPFSAGEAER